MRVANNKKSVHKTFTPNGGDAPVIACMCTLPTCDWSPQGPLKPNDRDEEGRKDQIRRGPANLTGIY